MPNYICSFFTTLTLLSFQSFTSCALAGQHIDASHNAYLEPHINRAVIELEPWFDEFEKELRNESSYQSFVGSLRSQFSENENVICTFEVQKNGDLGHLNILISSSDKTIDGRVMSLVRGITFKKAPNNLPEVCGIKIEFWKSEGQIYFWSQLHNLFSKKIDLIDFSRQQKNSAEEKWSLPPSIRYRARNGKQLAGDNTLTRYCIC